MLPTKRNAASGTERLGVVLLAAGYGTRLQRDIGSTPSLSMLAGTPKPLLPLCGQPILSHWLSQLQTIPSISHIFVVTNEAHLPLYQQWKAELPVHHHLGVSILSDGSIDNASRLGAIKDIAIGLNSLKTTSADKALIIACDTILPDIDMLDYVSKFVDGEHSAATFAYPLADMNDCVRRGMFKFRTELSGELIAEAVIEKPKSPELAPSNLASAPIYLLRKNLWQTLGHFSEEQENLGVPLEKRDAPGFWLAWLVPKHSCRLFQVVQRIDIGSLQHYKDALWDLTLPKSGMRSSKVPRRAKYEPAVGRAFPRAGFLGNPSDGYGGKVIAFSLASEGYAEVVATPHDSFAVRSNPKHEHLESYNSLSQFLDHVDNFGIHYGARVLVLAASAMFARVYKQYMQDQSAAGEEQDGKKDSFSLLPNCQLTYSTSIPARIGLSGSSAFILATLLALARYHGTSLPEINPDIHFWPKLMRSAETDLLGIACGLQDRVIQLMQGCVTMDFTGMTSGEEWKWLPDGCLPEMWIAYRGEGTIGEDSGKVHSNLRSRYDAKDSEVLAIVKELCSLVDSGQIILEQGAKGNREVYKELPHLISKNFQLRVALVGPHVVGKQNTDLVSIAKQAGLAAKMTGSGGCALCLPNPVRQLSGSEVAGAKAVFEKHDMVLHKVEVLPRREWLP
ncbi:unnamed protein product [Chondrus crispus]|uniref:GHMP kinase N-terminal domain-containing protein n=1 Tax=Chondrus crispus TaxID=2769 RepID=R7QKI3_CHOCR|nr:unnamed protein product [Chondrus crispus]CDF37915.1 unnamed protein product [Chondrus crispus]|eukprot:XP_005717786.1 unnamed protein product [Chondrus crispus]